MPEARRIVFRMLECDKPIIARVNGHAVGLGATVALLCDIIIAAEHAKIGDPHVNAGLVAGDGGALIWPQQIGFARAKEYLFTGDLMTATEAERVGLINHVVPAEQLDELHARHARVHARMTTEERGRRTLVGRTLTKPYLKGRLTDRNASACLEQKEGSTTTLLKGETRPTEP